MRPHLLRMKAFISYADEAVVDFDQIGNEVYAIVGDTGAGKTAIFDGLMFALYGECSGKGRSEGDYEEIHCDLCKHENGYKDTMEVELEFSNGDYRYKVFRQGKWGERGKAASMSLTSSLSKFDPAAGSFNRIESSTYKFNSSSNTVTNKIKEIIGLEADQFKNIVMIAQGAFADFLEASPEIRKKILGKVYKNQQHSDLQNRLNKAKNKLIKLNTTLNDVAASKLSELDIPDYCALTDEDREMINIDHPDLISVIDLIIARIGENKTSLEKEIKDITEKLKKKRDAKTAASESESLFLQLDQDREKLKKLEAEKTSIDELREVLKHVTGASKVLPYENAAVNSTKALHEAEQRKENLKNELKEKETEIGKLKDSSQTISDKNKPEIDKLTNEMSLIDSILPFYDALESSRKELSTAEKKRDNSENKSKALHSEYGGLQKELDGLEEILNGLENAGDPAVASAERELSILKEKQTSLKTFDKAVKEYQNLETELDEAKAKLEAHQLAVKKAVDEHKMLNDRFLAGQAILIADDLKERLETEAEVKCPVCGSIHTKADISEFAHSGNEDGEVPSRDDVTASANRRNEAEAVERNSFQRHENLKVKCEEKKASLLSDAVKLLETDSWDEVISGELFDKCMADCSDKIKAAKAAYTKAYEERELKTRTSTEKLELEKKITKAKEAAESAGKLAEEAKSAVLVIEAQITEQKKPLAGFPDTRAKAEAKRKNAGDTIEKLQAEIESAANKVVECDQEIKTLGGKIEGIKSELGNLSKRVEETKKAYENSLSGNGFEDESVYKTALMQGGVKLDANNIESWIAKENKKITDYDNSIKALETSIGTLEKQTEGKVRVDIKALEAEIEGLEKILDPKSEEFNKADYAYKNNISIKGKIEELLTTKRKYKLAMENLEPLEAEANSVYGEKFDAYVLRDFFKLILDFANERLDVMTNNRFNLIYDDSEAKGLGIRTTDSETNSKRKTNKFSGGQSFEASLALALGVADAVQLEQSKAIQIESIFIDEGFGTQDSKKLDLVMSLLHKLSSGNRQVGIISHVEAVEETELKKVRVTAGEKGSSIELDTYN